MESILGLGLGILLILLLLGLAYFIFIIYTLHHTLKKKRYLWFSLLLLALFTGVGFLIISIVYYLVNKKPKGRKK